MPQAGSWSDLNVTSEIRRRLCCYDHMPLWNDHLDQRQSGKCLCSLLCIGTYRGAGARPDKPSTRLKVADNMATLSRPMPSQMCSSPRQRTASPLRLVILEQSP